MASLNSKLALFVRISEYIWQMNYLTGAELVGFSRAALRIGKKLLADGPPTLMIHFTVWKYERWKRQLLRTFFSAAAKRGRAFSLKSFVAGSMEHDCAKKSKVESKFEHIALRTSFYSALSSCR